MNELSMWLENSSMYGFLELQSIQRYGQSQFEYEDYIKKYMHNSQRDVYNRSLLEWVSKTEQINLNNICTIIT